MHRSTTISSSIRLLLLGVLCQAPDGAFAQQLPQAASEAAHPVPVEARRASGSGEVDLDVGALPEWADGMTQRSALPTDNSGSIQLAPPSRIGSNAPATGTTFEGVGDTGFRPADPHLAVGPNHVLQVVNSTMRVSNRLGGIASTGTLQTIFGIPSGGTTVFDPVCAYDHFSGRFIVLTITRNSAKTDGWYILAVSKTGIPTTNGNNWWVYYLRNDIDFPNTDTGFWADYEKLGFDNTYFYITSNQFNSSNAFQYAKIRLYPKAAAYAGQSLSGFEFADVRDASNNRVFTIQPAITFGTPGSEYLAACSSGSGSSITFFDIAVSTRVMNRRSIAVNSWTAPQTAVQKDSTARLDSGDARLQNAVYRNNRFYTTHTAQRGTFPCAAQYIGVNTSNFTKSLDVTIGSPSFYYYYPAVAVSGNGNLGTIFNFSGSTRYPGSLYTQIDLNGNIQPLGLLREGQRAYTVNSNGRIRWGDYNGIAVDPSNSGRLWFNAMYAVSTADKWGTYVGSTSLAGGREAGSYEETAVALRDQLFDWAKDAPVFGPLLP